MDLRLGKQKFAALHRIGQRVYYIESSRKVTTGFISEIVFSYRETKKDGKCAFVFKGYRVDGLFDKGMKVYHHLDFYTDKKKAMRHVAFTKVAGVSEAQWKRAIGYLDDGDVEKSELANCYWNRENYDLLHRCRVQRGLIKRDIIWLRWLLRISKRFDVEKKKTPNLDLILQKLGINVK